MNGVCWRKFFDQSILPMKGLICFFLQVRLGDKRLFIFVLSRIFFVVRTELYIFFTIFKVYMWVCSVKVNWSHEH